MSHTNRGQFGRRQTDGNPESEMPQISNAARLRLGVIIFLIFVIYWLLQFGLGFYIDWLWFQNLGFVDIFTTQVIARVAVFFGVATPFAILFLINAFIARWLSTRNILFFSDEALVAQRLVGLGIWAVTLLLAWLVGAGASARWLDFLRFFNLTPFGTSDPIFEQDIGFYVFTLPIYQFAQGWILVLLFLCLFGAVGIYALEQRNNLKEGRLVILPHVQLHLSVLGSLIFLAFAWGHSLAMFDLLYSPRGVAFGASYTDITVTLPVLRILLVIAVAAAATLLANIYFRRTALPLLSIFVWITANFFLNGIAPAIVQRYVVEPNELSREAPYIRHNISFTRQAYGLDRIDERDFSSIIPLTANIIAANEGTLKNVRLWDTRPLLDTYQQIQAIRLYYNFPDVDVDRYWINGEYRQVMLAARELDKSQLQSPTWITQKMQFTHGYGLVVNPVNEVTRDGLPDLWVKDLPPKTTVGLEVTRPQIYYGEQTDDYVFVQTDEDEFDFPSGDENVYNVYDGQGGVLLDSSLKRVAFALHLADSNIILSNSFRPDSRVMLHRNIRERASKVAPFLRYDRDPYMVITEEGHLYWILDAFTVSDRYPYSEPIRGRLNYIRNAAKVVIDAYNGTMTYYVIEPDDPLIQTYLKIFPTIFQPLESMPDTFRQHLRYPEDLFSLQAEVYRTYHMQDVNVFYNKEDLWTIPLELLQSGSQPVEPYSVIINLPGEEQQEFLLIQPFTPTNKDNLIAWMAARADGENYGDIVVYRFPKQELIFGPLQIEARIDQDPEISAQISLWSQQGSQVIRGNLLVIPFEESLLYIEPLYLQAETGKIPELKRVIVSSGENVVMTNTFAEGLAELLDTQATLASTGSAEGTTASDEASAASDTDTTASTTSLSGTADEQIALLAQSASEHYEAAQAALQDGDWATYGTELEAMKADLDKLLELTGEAP
ncbi:MAG: UPF0182 family protein [Anaerolineae bacterium]